MAINIKITRATITSSVKEHINKNLTKLEKFLRPENNIHIELQQEPRHKTGLTYRAEITITPRPGMYAEARGNDFYEAIDLCMPKIKEQIMKNKDRKVSLRRKLGAQIKRKGFNFKP